MNESKGRIDETVFPQAVATSDQLSNVTVIVSDGCPKRRFRFVRRRPTSPRRQDSDRDRSTGVG